MKKRFLALLAAGTLLLTGCGATQVRDRAYVRRRRRGG